VLSDLQVTVLTSSVPVKRPSEAKAAPNV
jgi:hypothetical protein